LSAKEQARDSKEISAIMRRVRSQNTTPELRLRRELWAKGLRYKKYSAELPGKPDLVLPAHKLVIFIDGDLWHGNQWRRRGLSKLEDQFQATASKSYWLKKIRRNMERDCRATAALVKAGWTVLRFWEKDIQKNLETCVETTLNAVQTTAQTTPAALLPQKTFAEFFAGIGLMRIGLERQDWSISYANDIDQQKYEMYKQHFPDADKHFVVDDIHKLSADSIPSVSLATASFPCNDLSLAGARKGLHGKESSAFWGFTKILEGMDTRQPPLVLIENVPGFLTSHGGADFKAAMLELNRLGYSVDPFIINAACFVPQSRERLFIIGVLNGPQTKLETNPLFEPADTSLEASDVRPAQLSKFIKTHPEIKWGIRKLPTLPCSKPTLETILDDLPSDAPEWWSNERAEYLLNQMSVRHRQLAEQMIVGKDWSYGTVFRRMRNGRSTAELRTDGIAGCLRTPRGGSGRQILFKAGKGQYFARLITPREAARLMGADEYALPDSVALNQALFGFGDAVCVPVIEWIATYYLNPLVNELIRGQALALTA
jgi:DNA (cytosine-5)-methyltransferase 1